MCCAQCTCLIDEIISPKPISCFEVEFPANASLPAKIIKFRRSTLSSRTSGNASSASSWHVFTSFLPPSFKSHSSSPESSLSSGRCFAEVFGWLVPASGQRGRSRADGEVRRLLKKLHHLRGEIDRNTGRGALLRSSGGDEGELGKRKRCRVM